MVQQLHIVADRIERNLWLVAVGIWRWAGSPLLQAETLRAIQFVHIMIKSCRQRPGWSTRPIVFCLIKSCRQRPGWSNCPIVFCLIKLSRQRPRWSTCPSVFCLIKSSRQRPGWYTGPIVFCLIKSRRLRATAYELQHSHTAQPISSMTFKFLDRLVLDPSSARSEWMSSTHLSFVPEQPISHSTMSCLSLLSYSATV